MHTESSEKMLVETADLIYEGPIMIAVQSLGLFEDCKT
jgi:hypothetical protein